jgi:hypothetical protein
MTRSGLAYFMLTSDGLNRIFTASTVALNTWTHVAVVRLNGVVTIYLNGAVEGSATPAVTTTNAAAIAVFVTNTAQQCENTGTSSFTQPPPTCPMTGTSADVVAQAKEYCSSEPLCRGVMFSSHWNSQCVQYCTGTTLSSNSDWTSYTESSPKYVFYEDYSGRSPYVQGYCSSNPSVSNSQANLCATNWPVGGAVRGNLVAENPLTCTHFDDSGTSELGMTVAEVQAICSAEPNCAGYGEWTNGRFRLSSGMVGTTANTGIKCVRKVGGQPLGIGASPNGAVESFFEGYMTDIRITKGEALYTTSFDRPASALEPVANTVLLLQVRNTQNAIVDSSGNAFALTNYGVTYADLSPFI